MYQFGERYLVYNVNVCILLIILSVSIGFKRDTANKQGAVYEPRRKVTQDPNC